MSEREIRLITFAVGTEKFVFDIMAVRQILPYGGSTTIPRLPAFIEGVIVLRNEVIPVIDLRSRLFPDIAPPEKQPLVLVCRTSAGVLGLKVDEVRRIITVPESVILPPPDLVRGLQGDLFIGIIPVDDDVFLLLDMQTLLSNEEQESLRRADLAARREEIEQRASDSGSERPA
jgi:purine-binding chemotaxis protein CheW